MLRSCFFLLFLKFTFFSVEILVLFSLLLFFFAFFFFYQGFLSRTLTTCGQQGKGSDHLLIHSTTSTRSRTFRHLFATLPVRRLSHIFNRNACIYQVATRWDLPPYRITIWLIEDVMLIFVCLLVDLILGFVTAIWHEKNRWTRNSHRLSSLYYKQTD